MFKKLTPWIVGLGLLAVIAVICANVYDHMRENEDMQEEPAWIAQDSVPVVEVAND